MRPFKDDDTLIAAVCISKDEKGIDKLNTLINYPSLRDWSPELCASILMAVYSEIESSIDDDKQIQFAKETKKSFNFLFKNRAEISAAITV